MKKLLAAATLAALSLSVAGTAAAEPKQGGTLTFSYRIIAGHFNPAIASGTPTGIPGTQLFAALLRFDDEWNPQPYLAESWDISEDGLTVTVKLRRQCAFPRRKKDHLGGCQILHRDLPESPSVQTHVCPGAIDRHA